MMKKKRLPHVLAAVALALFVGLGLGSATPTPAGGGGGGTVRCGLNHLCFNQTYDNYRWCGNSHCAAGRAPPPGRNLVSCNC